MFGSALYIPFLTVQEKNFRKKARRRSSKVYAWTQNTSKYFSSILNCKDMFERYILENDTLKDSDLPVATKTESLC